MNFPIHPTEKLKHPQTKIDVHSLHSAVKRILLVAQCFGQFPVHGINSRNPESLLFKWKSLKIVYCILVCSGFSFVTIMHVYGMLRSGADLFTISDFMFYGCMLMTSLFFLQLATKWPSIINEWFSIEKSLFNYRAPDQLNTEVKWIFASFGFIAPLQYIGNILSQTAISFQCKSKEQSVLKHYFSIVRFEYIFSMITYSSVTGIYLQIIDIFAFFIWWWTDIFIIVMSVQLAMKFKQVNTRVTLITGKKYYNSFIWKELREDYNKVCHLSKTLDGAISSIVLVSFGHNLYSILIQLFNSLRNMRNNVEKVYFFFSFGILITRVIFVTLYGAWINDESKKPVTVLSSVTSEVYNLEIRRFIQQISFDNVALTGRSFFRITRSLIFSIAGAIVTYELVLIQFNENLLKEGDRNTSLNGC